MAKRRPGRPNLYEERVAPRLEDIGNMAKAGSSNKEIAEAVGVSYSAFSDYCGKYPDLEKVLRDNRLLGVASVKMALYKRAIGYEVEETKTSIRKDANGADKKFIEKTMKHIPGDVSAMNTYLRNYDNEFRDKDKLTYEFKKMELELKKELMEAKDW